MPDQLQNSTLVYHEILLLCYPFSSDPAWPLLWPHVTSALCCCCVRCCESSRVTTRLESQWVKRRRRGFVRARRASRRLWVFLKMDVYANWIHAHCLLVYPIILSWQDIQLQVFYAIVDQVLHSQSPPSADTVQLVEDLHKQYYSLPHVPNTVSEN